MVELPRIQPHLVPHQLQMAPPTLNTEKTVTTIIILPSLTNNSDTRLKGTETLSDHNRGLNSARDIPTEG